HFSSEQEAMCKSLFLAGVTRRFPQLTFGFLEGGVGWAATLYADLIGHWERRNRRGLENTDPQNLDHRRLVELAEKYAPEAIVRAIRDRDALFQAEGPLETGGIEELADFSACRIDRAETIRDLFVPSFYFGCEGRRSDQRVGLRPPEEPLRRAAQHAVRVRHRP